MVPLGGATKLQLQITTELLYLLLKEKVFDILKQLLNCDGQFYVST